MFKTIEHSSPLKRRDVVLELAASSGVSSTLIAAISNREDSIFEDRALVLELVGRLNLALDVSEFNIAARFFTPDAALIIDDLTFTGREAIEKYFTNNIGRYADCASFCTNPIFNNGPEGSIVMLSYRFVYHIAKERRTSVPALVSLSFLSDTAVNSKGIWALSRREMNLLGESPLPWSR